jgi:hypothetical protein
MYSYKHDKKNKTKMFTERVRNTWKIPPTKRVKLGKKSRNETEIHEKYQTNIVTTVLFLPWYKRYVGCLRDCTIT